MVSISSNHFSVDEQIVDAMNFLQDGEPKAFAKIVEAFPEWTDRKMSGSAFDTDEMGVDAEWGSWLADAIEEDSTIWWEDGEPWWQAPVTDDFLSEMVSGYVECGLWLDRPECGDDASDSSFSDENYSADDLGEGVADKIREQCADFLSADVRGAVELSGQDGSQCGHDFYLTRNHHGAGFWDRGYADEIGTLLTEAAQAYGDGSFYLGDDGKIHHEG